MDESDAEPRRKRWASGPIELSARDKAEARVTLMALAVPDGDCLIWTKTCNNRYGQVTIDGKCYLPHRLSYAAFVAPLPGGVQVARVCRRSNCVKPRHLRLRVPPPPDFDSPRCSEPGCMETRVVRGLCRKHYGHLKRHGRLPDLEAQRVKPVAERSPGDPAPLYTPRPKGAHIARYGLTVAGYGDLLDSQGGACAICGEAGKLVVDHDHSCCDKPPCCGDCVRGLLCGGCNTMLGMMKDDRERLRRSLDYLNAYVERRRTKVMSDA